MDLIGFLFGICSTFKGRIRSNIITIRDQSRINWITIESRMQEDHDELRIWLKNYLIPSGFNQELSYKEEEHRFIGEISAKIVDHPI